MSRTYVLALALLVASTDVMAAEEKGKPAPADSDKAAAPTSDKAPEAKGATPKARPAKKDESQAAAKGSKDLYATFVTSQGKIGVRLFPEQKPQSVKNFVELAQGKKEWTDPRTGQRKKTPLYDGTVFHRVIPNFMIQGGDPLGTGVGTPGFSIPDELDVNERFFDQPCQLAYANSGPNTNGSQFFITEVPTLHLNPTKCTRSPSGVCGYVRFGEGVCGCELVAKIARAGKGTTKLEKVVISKTKPNCQ